MTTDAVVILKGICKAFHKTLSQKITGCRSIIDVRTAYQRLTFFPKQGHVNIKNASLIPNQILRNPVTNKNRKIGQDPARPRRQGRYAVGRHTGSLDTISNINFVHEVPEHALQTDIYLPLN